MTFPTRKHLDSLERMSDDEVASIWSSLGEVELQNEPPTEWVEAVYSEMCLRGIPARMDSDVQAAARESHEESVILIDLD